MNSRANLYPPQAYSQTGELWWQLKLTPGKNIRFGDERKLSAWLAFNCTLGQIFTIRDLRSGLGEQNVPNSAEHLNRRFRELRLRDGWIIRSARDDGSLGSDEYRVEAIGWHPGTGKPRPRKDVPSDKVRRQVFERDKRTCVICGIAATEPYDDTPGKVARMTLGHRVPGMRLTREAGIDELQTECSRCNETVRDEIIDPVTLPELLPSIKSLPRDSKKTLLTWLENARRSRSKVESVYADSRRLSPQERDQLVEELRRMTGQI